MSLLYFRLHLYIAGNSLIANGIHVASQVYFAINVITSCDIYKCKNSYFLF